MTWRSAFIWLAIMAAHGAELKLGTNLDFERGLQGWASVTTGGYKIEADSAERVEGKNSLAIRYADAPEGTTGVFTQRFSADSVWGKRLILRGFIRTENIHRGYAGLWLRAESSDYKSWYVANMGGFNPRGTTPWQRYEVSIVVSPQSETIVFGGFLAGDGAAWFDDFHLEIEPAKLGYNLDFEEGLRDWGLPGHGYETAPDPAHPVTSKHSLRIRHVNPPPENAAPLGAFSQRLTPDSVRGKRVVLSGYIRTENVERGYAALWLRSDGTDGHYLDLANMGGFGPRGTTPWQRYEVGIVVNPQAAMVVFGGFLAGDGAAWFADFHLEIERPKLGYNLDFEDNYPLGPKDWIGSGGSGFVVALDPVNPRSGRFSLRVQGVGVPSNRSQVVTQSYPATTMRGRLILVSGYVRTEDVTGAGAYLWVQDRAFGQAISTNHHTPFASHGTIPWTRLEFEHFVSPQADTVGFGCVLSGSGTAWFDDLEIEILDTP